MSLDDIFREYFGKKEPKETHLECPITGSMLMSDGCDRGVMDPDHFYFAESDPSVRYARHPFTWTLFRLVNGDTTRTGAKASRYFNLIDEKYWVEMLKHEGLDDLLPINTPKKEVKAKIKEAKLAKEERKRKYAEGVANGSIIPLPISIVKSDAKLISADLVPVQPMSAPSGMLYYSEFSYTNPEDIRESKYPYTVNEINIDEITAIWDVKKYTTYVEHGDIQIGDVINEWNDGGWTSLAGRAGEDVVRNGEIIYKRLTRMS